MEYTSDLLRRAASLFFSNPESVSLIGSSERENDFRAAALVVRSGERFVVKLASNAFTHPARIEGWKTLIRETRSLGAYMPDLIPSRAGSLSESLEADGHRFTVWAEEFAPFDLAQTDKEFGDSNAYAEKDAVRPKNAEGTAPAWKEELILLFANLGAKHLPGGWGISGYARLTPFEGDETDEVEECVRLFERNLSDRFPALLPRFESLRKRWEENRDALAAAYPRLPTSVFQADWNDTNVLLTDDGHFAGLIDCNIAGEDTVLNMALSIGRCGFNGDGGWESPEKARAVLRLFSRAYRWNEDEIAAAPLLWRYISALYWGEVNDLKKAEKEEEAAAILGRIERQLSDEVDFRAAMEGGRCPERTTGIRTDR